MFCGSQPRKRSREHIIPRWLMKLTGDPNRKCFFGPFLDEKGGLVRRSFPLDNFAFPSCGVCNQKLSELESSAREVVSGILDQKPLSSADFGVLLTWLDKVRVGLWLGGYHMIKNVWGIAPQFFINSRMDKSDRMVLIYRSSYAKRRLVFQSPSLAAFQYQPTCFFLIVNNFLFLNVSTDLFLSRRLGLPYPSHIHYTNSPEFGVQIVKGLERVLTPVVKLKFDKRCTQILQPLFARGEIRSIVSSFYETDYVKSMSIDHAKGIGKVLYVDGPTLSDFPTGKTNCWVPPMIGDDREAVGIVMKQALEFQNYLLEYGPTESKIGFGNIDKEKLRLIRKQVGVAKAINRDLLDELRNPRKEGKSFSP